MSEADLPDRRRRLLVVSLAGALLVLGNQCYDVLGPLWATEDLGLTPSGWASLRSLRFAGTVIGTLLFALVATRLRPRLTAAIALGLAGSALAGMVLGGMTLVWVLVPVFGAAVSIVFVNLNALVQQAGGRRRGSANALYRGTQTAVAIAAPLLATSLAAWWGGYVAALVAGAVVLIAGGAAVLAHPRTEARGGPPPRWGTVLRIPALRRFVAIDQLATLAQGAWHAYFALRLTRDGGLSDVALGLALMLAATGAFLITVGSGWLIDRLPLRVVLVAAWLTMAVGMLVMGVTTVPTAMIVGHVLASLGAAVNVVATSVTIGALASGGNEALAFTASKVVQAAATALGMAAAAALGAAVGMGATLILGGGLLVAIALLAWPVLRLKPA